MQLSPLPYPTPKLQFLKHCQRFSAHRTATECVINDDPREERAISATAKPRHGDKLLRDLGAKCFQAASNLSRALTGALQQNAKRMKLHVMYTNVKLYDPIKNKILFCTFVNNF